jgi:hypothetical protein
MTDDQPKPPRQIQIEIPEDLEPIYSNVARISHSPAEIIMDFARLLPGQSKTQVQVRLLMSPIGVKMFYRALGENLARYENAFGEINLPGDASLANSLFRNIQPPDDPEKQDDGKPD